MISRFIHIVFFLLVSTSLYAQSYTISGHVKDDNNQPIADANLYILLAGGDQNTFIKGTTSNESGFFELKEIDAGNYLLTASFIGFKTVNQSIDLNRDISLELVLDTEAETLSEVEIIVKRPTIDRQADRLVFNVENTALTEGSVVDVLRSTPGVVVLDDVISIRNKTPAVYINDRKVHLSSSEVIELLQGTTATNIKSVEVITNPSARYDADSGAVLNIVMSKNLITGYRGSLYSNYTQGVYPRVNYGSSNFFKSKKIDLFLNYSYDKRKIDRVNDETVNYQDAIYKSNVDRNTWSETHTVNLNLDYNIDDANRLSFSSNMLFLPYFKYVTKNITDIDQSMNLINRFIANGLTRDDKHNLGFDLDYEHQFANGSNIRINGHATTYDYDRRQDIMSDYFIGNDVFFESTAFNTDSEQETEIITGQVDFSSPLGDQSNLEMGGKISNVQTNSSIIQRDIVNGQQIVDLNNTDNFDYDEDVIAGYVNLQTGGDNWKVNVGLRAEQTNVVGISQLSGDRNEQDYLEWFPSASLSIDMDDKWTTYTSYNRRIQRPNYTQLNPFQFFLNDNTIVTGNPQLQPIFINMGKIGLSYTDNYAFEFYYSKSDGNIFELPIQDNVNNIITFTPVNLDNTIEYGFDFLTYFDLLDNWSLSLITSFYFTADEGMVNGVMVDQDQWANYSMLDSNVTFLEDNSLSVTLSLVYSSRNLQGLQLINRDQLYSDLSIRKTILKGKGVLSASVSDIFNKQDFFVRTQFLDQDSQINSDVDTRYVRVGFRYNFGNTKLSTNEKGLSKAERDRLSERN